MTYFIQLKSLSFACFHLHCFNKLQKEKKKHFQKMSKFLKKIENNHNHLHVRLYSCWIDTT